MIRRDRVSRPLACAALLVLLAIACVIEPRFTVASATLQLLQAGLIFWMVHAVHSAQRRQVSAIDARLEEMRRLVRTIRVANANGLP